MSRIARIIAAPLVLAAALGGAATAQASPPVVPPIQIPENAGAVTVPVTAKCEGAKRCSYGVGTVSGDALSDVDYVAPEATIGTVRKNQTFTTQLVIPIVNDATPENTETFFVHIDVVRGKKQASFDRPLTIFQSDLPGFPF